MIKLYAQRLAGYEYLFHDISPLLQVPLDASLNESLRQSLHEHIVQPNIDSDMEKLQESIQAITLFLDDLKGAEEMLYKRSKEPLAETCGYLAIANGMLASIPSSIRCEHYMAVLGQLLQVRSTLEEQKLVLKAREKKVWQEHAPTPPLRSQQRRPFYQYMDSDDSRDSDDEDSPPSHFAMDSDLPENDSHSLEDNSTDGDTELPSIFELKIQMVPCRSSTFFEQMQKYREEPLLDTGIANKASKFTVVLPDQKRSVLLCRGDKFNDNLMKIFANKKYNPNHYVILGPNSMSIDLSRGEHLVPQQSPAEYSIVDKTELIQVEFRFQDKTVDYYTTRTNSLDQIVKHFIDAQQLKSATPDRWLCFHDRTGRCIAGGAIGDLHGGTIHVTEETPDNPQLCQVKLVGRP